LRSGKYYDYYNSHYVLTLSLQCNKKNPTIWATHALQKKSNRHSYSDFLFSIVEYTAVYYTFIDMSTIDEQLWDISVKEKTVM
jgi:hypothetical protein